MTWEKFPVFNVEVSMCSTFIGISFYMSWGAGEGSGLIDEKFIWTFIFSCTYSRVDFGNVLTN